MKLKILVIEDDPFISEIIQLYLEKHEFEVTIASDGEFGLDSFYNDTYDLVILDIMMPKMDGWEVCKRIRIDFETPIIMLTAKGETYDKVKGFDLGVDDYMVKPFEPEELVARIKAVLKRTSSGFSAKECVTYPSLTVNLTEYRVYLNGQEIDMPLKEISLLYYLASHPNRVFTRQQLIDVLWGFEFDGDPRTVDVHIKRVREKIKDNPSWTLKTIRGVGYKFEVVTNE
ncbi:response regulator transcription factor [Radiobacillus sp. PE A8.2]|uniref:response regulator transcription factor n=1 Tax=Radiobacillus sp. PE A8.2 TaxID=3380349 RepID=UPI00388EEF3D